MGHGPCPRPPRFIETPAISQAGGLSIVERGVFMPETKIGAEPVEEKRSALGAQEHTEDRSHLDFLTAIILLVISVATIITSIGYWQKQGRLFYESTGFMPTVIGGALLLMAIMLLKQSLKGVSLGERFAQLKVSFFQTIKSRQVYKAVGGLAIFALYVYVLLGRLPFWLASLITLSVVEVYTHWDGKWKTALRMLLISTLAVAGIVALFQYAFSVPMP